MERNGVPYSFLILRNVAIQEATTDIRVSTSMDNKLTLQDEMGYILFASYRNTPGHLNVEHRSPFYSIMDVSPKSPNADHTKEVRSMLSALVNYSVQSGNIATSQPLILLPIPCRFRRALPRPDSPYHQPLNGPLCNLDGSMPAPGFIASVAGIGQGNRSATVTITQNQWSAFNS